MTKFHPEGLKQLSAALVFLNQEKSSGIQHASAQTLLRSILFENFDTYGRRYKWASAPFVSVRAYEAWGRNSQKAYNTGGPQPVIFEHIVPVAETVLELQRRFSGASAEEPTENRLKNLLKKYFGPTALICKSEELRTGGEHNGLRRERTNRNDRFCRYRSAGHISLLHNPYYPEGEKGYYSHDEIKELIAESKGLISQKKQPRMKNSPPPERKMTARPWKISE